MSVSLSNREAEIMAVLWEQGASTVTEVKDKLSDELAYTTVLTILRNLEAKEYVGHEADGRAHRYFARIKQQVGAQECDPASGRQAVPGLRRPAADAARLGSQAERGPGASHPRDSRREAGKEKS